MGGEVLEKLLLRGGRRVSGFFQPLDERIQVDGGADDVVHVVEAHEIAGRIERLHGVGDHVAGALLEKTLSALLARRRRRIDDDLRIGGPRHAAVGEQIQTERRLPVGRSDVGGTHANQPQAVLVAQGAGDFCQRFPEGALRVDGHDAGRGQRAAQAVHDRHNRPRGLPRAGGPGDKKMAARFIAGPIEAPETQHGGAAGIRRGDQRVVGEPNPERSGSHREPIACRGRGKCAGHCRQNVAECDDSRPVGVHACSRMTVAIPPRATPLTSAAKIS